MEAIRTIMTVSEGHVKVNLPERFWGKQVEVIVHEAPIQAQVSLKKSLQGCLRQYANPAFIEREQEAWHDAVKEKHDRY
jgi:hypothetical protein